LRKDEIKVIVEKEEVKSVDKKESAADALLKRIALKKQKKEEEAKVEKPEKEKVQNDSPINEEVVEKKSEVKQNEDIVKEVAVIKNEEIEIESEEIKEEVTKPKKANKLIEDFINTSDTRERLTEKDITLKGDISVESSVEKEEFMTEAMADLFIQQKYFEKAINVYEKLILKLPQKKTYFAIQIKKVESLIKKNK